MSFLTGAAGFLICFLMLRRSGGIGRHMLAFLLGTIVSLALFGFWIAFQLSGRAVGDYSTEWLAGTWAFGIAVTVVYQLIAMIIARFVRRNAASATV